MDRSWSPVSAASFAAVAAAAADTAVGVVVTADGTVADGSTGAEEEAAAEDN